MKALDTIIAEQLNSLHVTDAQMVNKERKQRKGFNVGDKVWLLKPRVLSSLARVEARWTGPMEVVQQVGMSSYCVEDVYGTQTDAHLDQLKAYVMEERDEAGTQLEFRRTPPNLHETAKHGNIRDHRRGQGGPWEFLVEWEGLDPTEGTWEEARAFLRTGLLGPLWAYCHEHGVALQIPDVIS